MTIKELAATLRRLSKKEDGLVTVEWLAIAAACVIGGVALVWSLYNALAPGPGAAITDKISSVASTAIPVTLNP